MKGKKKVKEPAGMNIPEIFAALAMLEKERGIPQTFMMDKIIQAVTTAYKRTTRTWKTSLWTWMRNISG